ncbi:hypothetical protein ACFSKU_14280 [Pontibacter silvestris]|uniref:Outer membrane protein beta-barrel domain-containing protein n=1 Tax=Pontibacter silvestris TaxID=2305183 RepID=A0ABW4WZ91_9BACT|nr:hypothetical protein [Pontibacter silvestris]MCC9138224.1 hypothetical protein [Pontibacter silvestris]
MYKYLLLFLLFSPVLTLAQENESFLIRGKVKQGSIMIGGNAAGYYNKVKDDLYGSSYEANKIWLEIRAKNGYFIRHDWAIGLDISLHHESQNITTAAVRHPLRETSLIFGPFTRYYLAGAFFGEFMVGVGLHDFSSGPNNNIVASNLGVGYSYFINQQLAVEPILSFRYQRDVYHSQRRVSYGPMIGIGVQAFLLRQRSHIIKRGL